MDHKITDASNHTTMKEDLRTSEIRYRRLFESARDGILILDATSRKITDVNPFMVEFLGYSREELLGKELWEIGLFEDQDESQAAFRELQATGYIRYEDMPLQTKTGKQWNVEFISNVYRENGHHVIQCNIRDITARKRMETALREREETFNHLVDNITDAFWIRSPDFRKLLYVSPAFTRIWGRPVESLFANPQQWTDFILPEDRERVLAAFAKLRGVSPSISIEYRIVWPNGEVRWVHARGFQVRDAAGELILLTGIVTDITERKVVEEALRASIEEFRTLAEALPQIVWVTRPDGLHTHFNQRWIDYTGLTQEESLGHGWLLPFHPDDRERAAESWRQAIESGEAYELEHRLRGPDGAYRWMLGRALPLRDATGNIVKWFGTCTDIDDLKVAELEISRANREQQELTEQLASEKARLVAAQAVAKVGSWETDVTTGAVSWSEETHRIFETDAGTFEQTHQGFLRLVHPDDRAMLEEAFTRSLDVHSTNAIEHRVLTPNGRIKTVEERWHTSFDDQGRPLRALGTCQDITERKHTEKALQESETLYRLIVETANEGIWLIDLEGKVQFINPQAAQLLGYSVEEIQGRKAFEFLFQDDQDEAQRRFTERKKGHRAQSEFRARRKNGSEIRILSSSAPVRNQEGETTGLLGMLIDITEQKRAEEERARLTTEIGAQQERLRSIVDNVPGIVWESWWTMDSLSQKTGFVSEYVETMLGYSVEEWLSQPDFWLSVVYEEDKERAKIESAKIVSHRERGSLEYRMVTKDGRVVWVETQFVVIKSEGQPVGLRGVTINVTERKQASAALKESEANYRALVELSPAIVYLSQPAPPYAPIYVSPNIAVFGYPPEEWFSRPDIWISLIHDEDRERVLHATQEAMSQGLDFELEYRIVTRDDRIRWLHVKGCFIFDRQGEKTAWQGVMLDVTKTKELEEQLRQSQKLESIGLLAGGIAHDFNNMLTAINGYSELTLRRLKEGDPLRRNLEEIKKAGERSAQLTYQLLAFSRQQILQPKILSLNQVITDTSMMLERLIGEDIQLFNLLNQKAGQVEVDPGQLSQIIMNLAVNARDAMPQGGRLTIETDNVTLDDAYALHHVGTIAGEYVMMAVSDTGVGMNAETMRHLFEPFFTTKEVGNGTGLGLATVYGIVKQSGGNIWVYSEEGVGTTFKVYFPRVGAASEGVGAEPPFEALPQGTETILLVEDEEMVRSLTRQILEECGYTVLEANNGVEAVSLCEKYDGRIELLLTDVVMPQMGGRELAERLEKKYPQMLILFASGYTDDAVVRHGVIEAGTNFIQKPFTPDGLAHKVREVLDALRGS